MDAGEEWEPDYPWMNAGLVLKNSGMIKFTTDGFRRYCPVEG